ncbi:hypothetical protein V3C99_011783 [Haemonchus contortus]|uniref:Uncharacterized protein n=1 Tax=Haemonchus contortus TaxID=6289 RepID=A0A6F7PA80_HAECO|nr:unnamed protein product [Haemonchus contortus]
MCDMMDFYKAERNRVLWLRQQNTDDDTAAATVENMDLDVMSDENVADETCILTVLSKSGHKRRAQADLPILITNGKRAKVA